MTDRDLENVIIDCVITMKVKIGEGKIGKML